MRLKQYRPRDLSGEEDPINRSIRNFIILAHRARTRSDFPLNDLCGAGGRWDGIARCINSALFLSHDLRRDTSIHIVMTGDPDPPKVIILEGSGVKYLNPDERASVALIRKTLDIDLEGAEGFRWINPGMYVARMDLDGLLDRIEGDIIFLDEDGEDIHSRKVVDGILKPERSQFYILSDDRNPSEEEMELIGSKADHTASIGPRVLHSDHTITILHNVLDRFEDGS